MKKLFTLFLALAASVGTLFAVNGTCGANLTWDLTDGVLTISGSGDMAHWEWEGDVPWYSYHESITTVIIGDSVTGIGYLAFYGCIGLTSVTCKAVVPPTCGGDPFAKVEKSIPLYVPENSVYAYKVATEWENFTNIQGRIFEALDEITNDKSQMTNKVIKDGRLLILRGDKTYTLTGQEIK